MVAGRALRGVAFIDGQSGWIVGDKGLCLETRDGGRTWKAEDVRTQATLRSVRFVDAKVGIITGDGDPDAPKPVGHIVTGRAMRSGTAFWTQDGGETWMKSYLPTNFEVRCAQVGRGPVQFGISGGEDHLDGDILRSSTDLGAWNAKDFKSYRCYRALFDIRALDDRRWVAAGSPVSVGFMPTPTEALYTKGKCRVLFSDDGGETWSPANGSEGPKSLRALLIAKQGARVLAAGDAGAILASEDKGTSWRPLNTGCDHDLFALSSSVTDPQVIIAVGDKETTLVSLDGGQGWKRASWGNSGAFLSIASAGDWFIVVGENAMARRAGVKSLAEAKSVSPPAAPPKPGLTKAQRERVRVGDRSTYEVDVEVPSLNIKRNYQKVEKITSLTSTGFTLEVEVVKGEPIPGEPQTDTLDISFKDLPDYSTWKVGDEREERHKYGKTIRTRLADQTVRIGEKTWDCFVVQSNVELSVGSGPERVKRWIAKSAEIPGTGVVKAEVTMELDSPRGRVTLRQSTRLLTVGRGE
jgi:photosystem II stability/assembly factor-like uncharacterized protein